MFRTATLLVLGGLSGGLSARSIDAQFIVGEPLNEYPRADLYEAVASTLAEILNGHLDMPSSVSLTSARCGDPPLAAESVINAYYDPYERRVIFCSELMDFLWERRGEDVHSWTNRFASQTTSILYHEVGHALIDVLSLSVLGREDDAADQLSSLFMSNEPIWALSAASFWNDLSNGRIPDIEAMADSHSLDAQRYYNLSCWAYGADPWRRDYIILESGLPDRRKQRCEEEYDQMKASWETELDPYLRNPEAFSSWLELGPRKNISGIWVLKESRQDEEGQVICSGEGKLTLWQSGSAISGAKTGACTALGSFDDSANLEIFTGRVFGEGPNGLGFEVDAPRQGFGTCGYAARIEGPDFIRLEGNVDCDFNQSQSLSGSWSAVRR